VGQWTDGRHGRRLSVCPVPEKDVASKLKIDKKEAHDTADL